MSLTPFNVPYIRRLAGGILASGLVSHVAAAGSEAAPTKVQCAQAFEESQRLRNASRYLDANFEALKCTNPSCGPAISEECSKIYNELQSATPSVVFGARDKAGNELANVKVVIDDGGAEYIIDGKPVAIDPGNHTFTFRAERFREGSESTVIRAGEKFRALNIVLESTDVTAGSSAPRPAIPARSSRAETPSAIPTGAVVLGGVAIIGLGGFVGFRAWGSQGFDDLSQNCRPNCSASSVDSVRQKYLLSSVSLAVGGAAAVGAVTWYFVGRPSSNQSSARLGIGPSMDGVEARFATTF